MQIIMFDRQSIFIHGMKISLQQRIPGVGIQGVGQADELWQKLESYPEALVMLDGDQDGRGYHRNPRGQARRVSAYAKGLPQR